MRHFVSWKLSLISLKLLLFSLFYATSCILQRHHNLAFNRIIFLFLKLSQNLLILSHYVAFILLLHLSMILQTHNMNFQNMILKQMQSLFDIIWVLQTEITNLKALHTLTLSLSQENLIFIIMMNRVVVGNFPHLSEFLMVQRWEI